MNSRWNVFPRRWSSSTPLSMQVACGELSPSGTTPVIREHIFPSLAVISAHTYERDWRDYSECCNPQRLRDSFWTICGEEGISRAKSLRTEGAWVSARPPVVGLGTDRGRAGSEARNSALPPPVSRCFGVPGMMHGSCDRSSSRLRVQSRQLRLRQAQMCLMVLSYLGQCVRRWKECVVFFRLSASKRTERRKTKRALEFVQKVRIEI